MIPVPLSLVQDALNSRTCQGFMKRVTMREKPRDMTGPFENPVRRFVRQREKAQEFCQLPPPRRVPVAKPPPRKIMGEVPNVPTVSPEVLERRLEFLLSENAARQQEAAPMVAGSTPYQVELHMWERQMRDLRKIYRGQYLQKLSEVTAQEILIQRQMQQQEYEERVKRKRAHLDRLGEERKRQAILKDRLRIEAKVNEAIEMARRSKIKRKRLFWLRTYEGLANYITRENLDIDLPNVESNKSAMPEPLSGAKLFSRNVSVPFILRQMGCAKEYPTQKNRRIGMVDNVEREIREASYEYLGEDDPQFEQPDLPRGVDPKERAKLEYENFTEKEKMQMIEKKIAMLQELQKSQKLKEEVGVHDVVLSQLVDSLQSSLLAAQEKAIQATLAEKQQTAPTAAPTETT
eukprot:GEMP01062230.1.p1 GENE.GEMP01062230.1~~GEMP01062230.1.p1  ORF type:complete len:405 (+),score=123.16 GEMP01062230.1:42-1256(+)